MYKLNTSLSKYSSKIASVKFLRSLHLPLPLFIEGIYLLILVIAYNINIAKLYEKKFNMSIIIRLFSKTNSNLNHHIQLLLLQIMEL